MSEPREPGDTRAEHDTRDARGPIDPSPALGDSSASSASGAPRAPSDQTGPSNPSNPSNPSGPSGPSGPGNPSGPSDPSDPTDPSDLHQPSPLHQPSDAHEERDPLDLHPQRRIRSFVLRAGRIGPGQARALAELGPRFVLPFRPEPIDPEAVFGRRAPLVLEIGFGMGDATARIAAARPDTDFLGCEVHEPGVGALLRRIDELSLANLRIVQHDAVEVLERMIARASLAGIHVFFPDPWHKKKHHKRRLIQPAFVARLVTRLAPGGTLHCATDWEPYAQQMLEVLSAEPALANTAEAYAPRPDYRPLTKFEQRGLRLGHGVWDLVFVRRVDAAPPATGSSVASLA